MPLGLTGIGSRRDSSVAGRPTGPRSSRAAAARAARSLLGRRPCSRERIRRRAGGAIPATRCVRVRRGSPCQPRPAAAAAACAACCTRGRRAAGWPRRCTAYAARAGRGHRGRTSRRGSCWPRRSVAAATDLALCHDHIRSLPHRRTQESTRWGLNYRDVPELSG